MHRQTEEERRVVASEDWGQGGVDPWQLLEGREQSKLSYIEEVTYITVYYGLQVHINFNTCICELVLVGV